MFGYSKCRQPVGPMSVSTTDDEQMLSFCPGRLAFKIEGAQNRKPWQDSNSSFLDRLEKKLVKEYNDILKEEKVFWYQKSQVSWLKFGDRNTRSFHTTTFVRRRKSRAVALKKSDGTWCDDKNQLKDMAVDYLKLLYTDTLPSLTPLYLVALLPLMLKSLPVLIVQSSKLK